MSLSWRSVFNTSFPVVLAQEGMSARLPRSVAVAFITPVVILVSRKRGRFTLPHDNMNIVAAAVYPAIMTYIIGWQYAWVILIVVFVVGMPVAINNTISTVRAGR